MNCILKIIVVYNKVQLLGETSCITKDIKHADKLIERTLKSSEAVLVTGPKFCGKTTTSLRYQKSLIRLNTNQSINIARIDPSAVVNVLPPVEAG